jgi:hypothetical protein
MAIGFSMAACGDEGSDGSGGGGGGRASTLTVTGIPAEYNGKYAICFFMSNNAGLVYGYQEPNSMAGVLVSNGTVSIPLWADFSSPYSGNETAASGVTVDFWDRATGGGSGNISLPSRNFRSVTFSNGGAVVSWGQGY